MSLWPVRTGYSTIESSPSKASDDSIQPMWFLSKRPPAAEHNYWPTELEIAGVCWAIHKLRPLIEAAPKDFLFTDRSAIAAIARQQSMFSSYLEPLNLHLIRASQYLSQFQIDVRYRPRRNHIVPDALCRLERCVATKTRDVLAELAFPDDHHDNDFRWSSRNASYEPDIEALTTKMRTLRIAAAGERRRLL